MLLGNLGTSLLGNILTGKEVIRAGEGTIRPGQNISCCIMLSLFLKYKSVIKMNLNLMVFIEEILYLK